MRLEQLRRARREPLGQPFVILLRGINLPAHQEEHVVEDSHLDGEGVDVGKGAQNVREHLGQRMRLRALLRVQKRRNTGVRRANQLLPRNPLRGLTLPIVQKIQQDAIQRTGGARIPDGGRICWGGVCTVVHGLHVGRRGRGLSRAEIFRGGAPQPVHLGDILRRVEQKAEPETFFHAQFQPMDEVMALRVQGGSERRWWKGSVVTITSTAHRRSGLRGGRGIITGHRLGIGPLIHWCGLAVGTRVHLVCFGEGWRMGLFGGASRLRQKGPEI